MICGKACFSCWHSGCFDQSELHFHDPGNFDVLFQKGYHPFYINVRKGFSYKKYTRKPLTHIRFHYFVSASGSGNTGIRLFVETLQHLGRDRSYSVVDDLTAPVQHDGLWERGSAVDNGEKSIFVFIVKCKGKLPFLPALGFDESWGSTSPVMDECTASMATSSSCSSRSASNSGSSCTQGVQ